MGQMRVCIAHDNYSTDSASMGDPAPRRRSVVDAFAVHCATVLKSATHCNC